jgi:hypothetical protein
LNHDCAGAAAEQPAAYFFFAESAALEAASAALAAVLAALEAELAALEAALASSAALLALVVACEASELALAASSLSLLVDDEAFSAFLWHALTESIVARASKIALFFTVNPP